MTLLITEVSSAGIAMISDTMIRQVGLFSGAILTGVDPTYQQKLFQLPKLGPLGLLGAVSYWGTFGLITQDAQEFENWIAALAKHTTADSLGRFAQELSQTLNEKCGNRPLKDPVGFHVVGYDAWEDVLPRPTFYHVHNGDLHTTLTLDSQNYFALAPTGSANVDQPKTWNDGQLRKLVSNAKRGDWIHSETIKAERTPFQVHCDFPDPKKTKEQNLAILNDGYLTANGEYFRLALKREYESLMEKKQLRPLSIKPLQEGYLEKRLAWMIESAQKIAADMERENQTPSFGGPYQELSFTAGEIKVCRGRGLDFGFPLNSPAY